MALLNTIWIHLTHHDFFWLVDEKTLGIIHWLDDVEFLFTSHMCGSSWVPITYLEAWISSGRTLWKDIIGLWMELWCIFPTWPHVLWSVSSSSTCMEKLEDLDYGIGVWPWDLGAWFSHGLSVTLHIPPHLEVS